MTTKKLGACGLCDATCAVEVELDGDEVVAICGDRQDPFSQGHVCPKAQAHRDLLRDPDRLTRPVVRERGGWRQTGEYGELVENLAGNPKAVMVWAHWCGLAPPEMVRALLQRLPNLHCDLAWIHKLQSSLPSRLIDGRGNFVPQWKALIEEFPDRFLAAGSARTLQKVLF